jgi:hypothetical protein
MGFTATHGFVNDALTRKDALRDLLVVPADSADHAFPVDGMVGPFRRASIVVDADFNAAYGAGPAGMTMEVQASFDGVDWFVTTIHDRLAVPPAPLVNDPDAIIGDQHIQAEAIVLDTDIHAEVADIINHFPYYRLVFNTATIPCDLRAWLHTSG